MNNGLNNQNTNNNIGQNMINNFNQNENNFQYTNNIEPNITNQKKSNLPIIIIIIVLILLGVIVAIFLSKPKENKVNNNLEGTNEVNDSIESFYNDEDKNGIYLYSINGTYYSIGQSLEEKNYNELYKSPIDAINDNENKPSYLKLKVENGIVTGLYVEFLITNDVVKQNKNVNIGKYTFEIAKNTEEYKAIKTKLLEIFKEENCNEYLINGIFSCKLPDFYIQLENTNISFIEVSMYKKKCRVNSGRSNCYQY